MSTQPGTDSDLDRTEELPQLDVAAYEASMAEQGSISSTDTWSVQALRDATLDEEAEDRSPISPFRSKTQRAAPGRSADLTLDAGRILARVAQLEAELASSKASSSELERRCESLVARASDQDRAVEALQAENARLTEQHSIGIGKVQSLEHQLRTRTAELEADLQRLQSSHAAASAESEAARRALEQRVAASVEQLGALNDTNARLQEELHAAAGLAQERAAAIEDLQDRLEDQEDQGAQMARYLAAKLLEHDTLSAALEQREQGMETLQSTCDDLTDELERVSAQLTEATSRAGAAERELLTVRNEQVELARQRALEAATRNEEIARLRGDADAATVRTQQLDADLQSSRARQAEQHGQIEELQQQLTDAQRDVGVLHAELSRACEQIATLELTSTELLDARGALSAGRAELEQANEQIGTLRSEVEQLREQIATQARQLEVTTADLDAANELASQSQPAIEELEIALRARDELVGNLRAELQTAQDERGIMAGQLDKARARNKKLAHEVFQRDKRISTLQEDLAVHAETLAAIRQDVSRVGAREPLEGVDESQRILEPLGHDGPPILLNRKVITVGRTSDNDACIPSKLVSRHHARLLVGPNAVIVEDAGSTNGCYVNDRLVKQQLMRDGDVLSLGDLRYRLRAQSPQLRPRDNVISMADRDESE